jgi:hypothetical protein
MDGPYFCHKREGAERAHPPDWDELWDDDEPPHAAKFVVYRQGMDRASPGIAHWKRYAFEPDPGKPGKTRLKKGLWQTNPTLMLGYKAMVRALNTMFPGVMPPGPERDDTDIDEPDGYRRDEPLAEGGPGAGAAEGANPVTTPRPGPRTQFVVPTREQAERVSFLRGQAPGLGERRAWLEYVSRVVGWVVTDTRELDRGDTADLIWRMEAELGQAQESEPDPDELPPEEDQ